MHYYFVVQGINLLLLQSTSNVLWTWVQHFWGNEPTDSSDYGQRHVPVLHTLPDVIRLENWQKLRQRSPTAIAKHE